MLASFKLKLAAYFVLLAVLPLAAAFWGFGAVLTHLEERRVDSRLQAELRAVNATFEHELARATGRAQSLARRPEVQDALGGDDFGSLLRFAGPQIGFESANGSRKSGRMRFAATRSVRVYRGKRLLGFVVAVLPLDRALARRLRVAGGLSGHDRIVFLWDRRARSGGASLAGGYRVLASPLREQPRARLAILAPRAAIATETESTRRQLFLVLLGGLVLIAAIATAEGRSIMRRVSELATGAAAIGRGKLDKRVPVRGRDEFARLAQAFNSMADQLRERLAELQLQRTRLHDSIARFGEVLAATHDVDQLLPVIGEAAVAASKASGAILVTEAGRVLELGDVEGGRKWVEVPISSGEASFGKLVVVGHDFAQDDLVALRSLAAQAAVAIENAQLHEAVERQAFADGLTGLANRRRCEESLEAEVARAKRYGSPLSVVLCDLDDFKAANDTLGHAVGDRILQEFGAVLREAVRAVDVAGRWGGEEFLVLLPGTHLSGALEAAERIRSAFAGRGITGPVDQQVAVTASFGVASFSPGVEGADLVASADAALYAAKRGGKNRVEASNATDHASAPV